MPAVPVLSQWIRLTLNGGTIIYNRAGRASGTINTDTGAPGGGVYIGESGVFTMNGGVIAENSADGNDDCQGGGVYIGWWGTFNMNGGVITSNRAQGNGGGVYVYSSGTFNLSGNAVVSSNKKSTEPNNVYLANGNVIHVTGTLNGATPVGVTAQNAGVFMAGLAANGSDASNFTSDNSEYAVSLNGDGEAILSSFYLISFEAGYENPQGTMESVTLIPGSSATNYELPACSFTAPDGKTFAGWKIGNTNNVLPAGETIEVDGNVTLTATWLSAWGLLHRQINAAENDATITLTEDVTALADDNYLYIGSGKIITLNLDGHILNRGLSASNPRNMGCVISMGVAATLTLTGGGVITGGSNNGVGGGVDVGYHSTLNIVNCSVTGNYAANKGGGVYLYYDAILSMSGGSITGNTAGTGGGVYLESGNNMNTGDGTHLLPQSYIRLSGSPVITGNTGGNVYLKDGEFLPVVTVIGQLASNASIGVSSGRTPTADAPAVVITSGLNGRGDVSNFVSDNSEYGVKLAGGEASLQKIYTITIAEGIGNGTVTASPDTAFEGDTVTLTVAPAEGAVTSFVKVNDDELTPVNGVYSFTMPAQNVTVTAEFLSAWGRLQQQINVAANGAIITLTGDLTAGGGDTCLTIPAGKSITIDLQGHTLDRGLAGASSAADGGSVFKVDYQRTLTLTSNAGTGTITGGYNDYGGAFYVDGGGTLNLENVTVSGNRSVYGASAIHSLGTVNIMAGTVLCGNTTELGYHYARTIPVL